MLQLIKTKDGSLTIYNTEMDEHYHSINGAVQESLHVFIQAGLEEILKTKTNISILEVGLGTGLNFLLTLSRLSPTLSEGEGEHSVNYTALEPFPIEKEFLKTIDYSTFVDTTEFQKIHDCEFNTSITLAENFTFSKSDQKIQDITFNKTFDLVYYDAFGPRVQPEMWTLNIFEKLFAAMNPDSVFVTYCAKGEVKRFLKQAGFIVETWQGPPGKREMVRGRK